MNYNGKPPYTIRMVEKSPYWDRWQVFKLKDGKYNSCSDKMTESQAIDYMRKLYVLSDLELPDHLTPWYKKLYDLFLEFWQ